MLVKVIPEGSSIAPEVTSRRKLRICDKSRPEAFGHLGTMETGRLGTGDYLTKDIPNKTNILATYTDIEAGDGFFLALRSDGSVWATGNNKDRTTSEIGTTKNANKLVQIVGLSKITKIAAGSNFRSCNR
ncbi:MAG: hypothetical protein K2H53_05410 [Clostridia bacterium]|nr:hypothetical protein [Clostridia bacterium]